MTKNPESEQHNGLRAIAQGLWETISPVRFVGIPMPARTVIARLGDGGLFVHSPGKLTEPTKAAIDALGPVRALIAPNRFHHMFVGQWQAAYPDAAVHVAPSLGKKVPDLEMAEKLSDTADPLWASDIDQHVWAGIPIVGEVVFVHKPSRTLLNTDMMHNMQSDMSFFARAAWRMLGSYQRFGPSRLEKWSVKDRPALRESVERVLSWDFDRVTVAHGDVLESGGKDRVRDGWEWVA